MTLDDVLDYSQLHGVDIHLRTGCGVYVRPSGGPVALLTSDTEVVELAMAALAAELGCTDDDPTGSIVRQRRWLAAMLPHGAVLRLIPDRIPACVCPTSAS